MLEFLLLVLSIFFRSLDQSHCTCPSYFSNSKTIESIPGDTVTLACSTNKCDLVAWFNLTSRSYDQYCYSSTCGANSNPCSECILEIHDLQYYHTGPYSCLCKMPTKKTRRCIEVIALCQMWVEINDHRTDYIGSVSVTAESLNYVDIYEHGSLAVGCLPGAVLESNCSSSQEPDVTMVLDWCHYTCTQYKGLPHSCRVDIIVRVSPLLSTLPTPTSSYEPPSTPKVTAVDDVSTLLPSPSTSSHAQTTNVDFLTPSSTDRTGSSNGGADERGGTPQHYVNPQRIVFFLITSVSVCVLLLLFAITLLRIYLLYFKRRQDKDKSDIYRPDNIYGNSTTSGENNDSEVKNGAIPHQQQPTSV